MLLSCNFAEIFRGDLLSKRHRVGGESNKPDIVRYDACEIYDMYVERENKYSESKVLESTDMTEII